MLLAIFANVTVASVVELPLALNEVPFHWKKFHWLPPPVEDSVAVVMPHTNS